MDAFILSGVRTPIGKVLGGLSELTAPQLGSIVTAEALKRSGIDAGQVDEVIFGNVLQAGVGQNPARQCALAAGFPDTVAAFTVNKVCGSGLKAVMLAAQAIRAGDMDLLIAGGTESMSNAPYLLPRARTGYKYGHQQALDAVLHDGLWCPFEDWAMGDAAEHVADRCGISRDDQDQFSAESHRRAAAAWESGAFADEVIPVTVGRKGRETTVERDEGIRADTTAEGLAKLKPVFRPDGTVTAGNASQLSDGAAAVVVASGKFVEQSGAKPIAKILGYATSGIDPKNIFLAPVDAVRRVADKVGVSLGDVDLFELNEAFASQMLGCNRELKLDPEKTNVHGGGVALGHPIGASGARVLVTLVHALKRLDKRLGIASLCLGGGNAVAMAVERMN